jgi:amino acid transporter
LILLTWILGGVFASLGAMCFAELSSIFPSAGGDYTYFRNIYSSKGESLVSFLFAWTQIFVIRPSSIAILALIIGNELDKKPFSS